MNTLADIRKEYTQASLHEDVVKTDPFAQFHQWFSEALTAQVMEPNAMNLSTVNEQGRPSGRIVLLKGVEGNRFIFYTNYQSKKGKDLEVNSFCALTFFWPELERQIRVEGIASRVDEATAVRYFQSRPRGSQVGAWTSPQSTVIKDRSVLEQRALQMEERFRNSPVLPKPHQWGGFQVEPFLAEFWQGRANRLHDRIQYALIDGKWQINRLAP